MTIQQNVAYAEFKEQVMALKVVTEISNSAGPKGQAKRNGGNGDSAANAFNLNLVLTPGSAEKLAFSTNQRKEIVTVEGKPMVSMPSASVEGMMLAKSEKDGPSAHEISHGALAE